MQAVFSVDKGSDVWYLKRVMTKKHYPGIWGPAVSGTVEKDESYFQNIVKETEEEIGILSKDIKEYKKDFNDGKYKHFTMWYKLKIDKDISEFKIQESEVDEIKWIPYNELKKDILKHPEKYLLGLVKKINNNFFKIN